MLNEIISYFQLFPIVPGLVSYIELRPCISHEVVRILLVSYLQEVHRRCDASSSSSTIAHDCVTNTDQRLQDSIQSGGNCPLNHVVNS